MKITKQVLKKMIKEELKQVQTNESSQGSKPNEIRDAHKALQRAMDMINTRPEFAQVLGDWLQDLDNMEIKDIAIQMRLMLRHIIKNKGLPGSEVDDQATGDAQAETKAATAPDIPELQAALNQGSSDEKRTVTKGPSTTGRRRRSTGI
jgi:hypothetical protein